LNEEIPPLAHALAAYLRASPLACDTCEGIRYWWLGPAVTVSVQGVQDSLDWMVARGVMERLVAADGQVRYRRSTSGEHVEEKLREIARS
jgi:hypothetical protein